jgi:hypothetical protein
MEPNITPLAGNLISKNVSVQGLEYHPLPGTLNQN